MTDWNACKAACHQAAVEGRITLVGYREDDRMAELRKEFPGWDIWLLGDSPGRRRAVVWCARPEGAPVAIFHAWEPDELASKIRTAEAEAGKP